MYTRTALEMNIISLLNFEDGIKDECGLTWYGNNRTTTGDKKFGTKSLYFSGQTIYCPISSIAPMYNQKDFSIGWWQKITGTDHYAGVVSSGFRGMILYYFDTYSITTGIYTFIIGNGNNWFNPSARINLDTSQWHHFLFSKSKNKLRSYFDGKLIHSQNYSGYNIGFGTNLIIGQWDTHGSTGYMDNFFISSEPIVNDFDVSKPFKKIEKNNLILQEKENMYAKID